MKHLYSPPMPLCGAIGPQSYARTLDAVTCGACLAKLAEAAK